METTKTRQERNRALVLGTLAFTVSFSIWGLLSGIMSAVKADLGLTAGQTAVLLSLPVIIGSLSRIPVGLVADRYGGKIVFTAILLMSAAAALALGFASSYEQYLLAAALLGIAGSSFAVGISFVSRWCNPAQQGTFLGIFGTGNAGHSLSVFGAPALATMLGIKAAVWSFAASALLFTIVFATMAKDAPAAQSQKSFGARLKLFFQSAKSWVLSLFYFQTFGGFVALSVFLPLLLKDLFGLSPVDAGLRTALFVLLATMLRPLGGWLADRFGGERLLLAVFCGLIPCGFLLAIHDLGYFTVGALLASCLLGIGNGAVFKLVPQYFAEDVGAITGLVGAAGGLGGFFPPLLLGFCMDHFGSYNYGFYTMSAFSLLCLAVLYYVKNTKAQTK